MSPFMTEFQTFFNVMMAALGDFWFWFANTIIGRIIYAYNLYIFLGNKFNY